MGLFTQQIFIPRPLYAWMPMIYLLTGTLLILVFANALVKLAGLMLIAFAVYILVKRFSKPTGYGKVRSNRKTVRHR